MSHPRLAPRAADPRQELAELLGWNLSRKVLAILREHRNKRGRGRKLIIQVALRDADGLIDLTECAVQPPWARPELDPEETAPLTADPKRA